MSFCCPFHPGSSRRAPNRPWEFSDGAARQAAPTLSLVSLGTEIVEDQLIQLSASGSSSTRPGPRDQQFVIGEKLHRLFVGISTAILQPANHPLIDRFSADQRRAMSARSDEEADTLSSAPYRLYQRRASSYTSLAPAGGKKSCSVAWISHGVGADSSTKSAVSRP